MKDPKRRGKGSGGITGKGFQPGKSGNPGGGIPGKRALMTRVMSVAMLDAMGDPIPNEPDKTFAGRIGQNAILVLDQQLEWCRHNRTFSRELIPLLEFVAERMEGKITQPIHVTKSLETRSDEDLVFYTQHKHFPDEPCACPPSA